jgi:hypothetical protein
MLFGAIQNLSSRVRGRRPLTVRWFNNWRPELDAALADLPDMPSCPHDLFRVLMQAPADSG